MWLAICTFRVPSRGVFWVLNPHQNHLDPHFIWQWVQWTLCIDLTQAGSNFSYGILKSLVCWWPQSSLVLYNVVRKYSICSRIKCQLGTCAQHPASTPERVSLLLQTGLGSIHFFQFNSIPIQAGFRIFQFNSIPIQIRFTGFPRGPYFLEKSLLLIMGP